MLNLMTATQQNTKCYGVVTLFTGRNIYEYTDVWSLRLYWVTVNLKQ